MNELFRSFELCKCESACAPRIDQVCFFSYRWWFSVNDVQSTLIQHVSSAEMKSSVRGSLETHIYPEKLKKAETCRVIVPLDPLVISNLLSSRSIKMNMCRISEAYMNRCCQHPIFFHPQGQSRPQSMEVHLRSVPLYSPSSGVAAALKSAASVVLWLSISNLLHLWPIKLYKIPSIFICMPGLKLLINFAGAIWGGERESERLCICYVKVISTVNGSAHMMVMAEWMELRLD